MVQYRGTVQFGGFYNNGIILPRTRPWRTDGELYDGAGWGDIPKMSGSIANYCPYCGYLVERVFSDITGHKTVFCKKCKEEYPANPMSLG